MIKPLTHTTRALLDAILDQLVPASPQRNILGAGAAGVGDFIEAQCCADSSMSACIDDLLDLAQTFEGEVNPALVRQLEALNSESFQLLVRLTYMGYYSRADNRSAVGVASWPVHPKGYEVARESSSMLEELIAPVRARGPIYRKA